MNLLRFLVPLRQVAATRRGLFRALAGLSVGFPSAGIFYIQGGCVYDRTGGNLAENELDSFEVNPSGNGQSLETNLQMRAEYLGLELAWHDSVAPDQEDAKASVSGRRLVRWGYAPGETATKFYRFEIYPGGDEGDPLAEAEVSLTTILQQGWTVTVVEVANPLSRAA